MKNPFVLITWDDEMLDRVESGEFAFNHACKKPTENVIFINPLDPEAYTDVAMLLGFLYGMPGADKQCIHPSGEVVILPGNADAMNN